MFMFGKQLSKFISFPLSQRVQYATRGAAGTLAHPSLYGYATRGYDTVAHPGWINYWYTLEQWLRTNEPHEGVGV